MGDFISLKFEGGADLAKAFDQLPPARARSILRRALEEGAQPIADYAGSIAPRRPGLPDIADKIVVGPGRSEGGEPSVAVGPERPYHYGLPLELGTYKMPAEPFMRPALDAKAEEALAIVGSAAWRELAGRGISRPTTVAEGPVESEGIGLV